MVPATTNGDLKTRCNTEGAITQYADCLLVKAFNENDEVWSAELARLGVAYHAPSLSFFDGSVQTACDQQCPNLLADHLLAKRLSFLTWATGHTRTAIRT